MAPITPSTSHATKRTSTEAGFNAPNPAKQQLISRHRHSLRWQQDTAGASLATCLDDDLNQFLLSRSLSLALEAVGFNEADPVALESFRAHVEEYMAHFLASVRQSMLSCRRSQTTPQDFLYALKAHNLTLRSLLRHLESPIPPELSQPRLIAEAQEGNNSQKQFEVITTPFNRRIPSTILKTQIPPHFPGLPSEHTYKFEEVYTSRETDPRIIREQATEERRLGEEALRKLVRVDAVKSSAIIVSKQKLTVRDRGRTLWRETLASVLSEDARASMEMTAGSPDREMETTLLDDVQKQITRYEGFTINADRRYWRKGLEQKKTGVGDQSEQVSGVT